MGRRRSARLQSPLSRLKGRSPRTLARAKAEAPVTWVAFDMCYLDGASFLDQPYRTRRAALEDLDLSGPSWHTTPASLGEGLAMLRAAKKYDLEGVVAKRLDGRYLPGAGHGLESIACGDSTGEVRGRRGGCA
jgi:bifunctional non-homologous end joining protein LigD